MIPREDCTYFDVAALFSFPNSTGSVVNGSTNTTTCEFLAFFQSYTWNAFIADTTITTASVLPYVVTLDDGELTTTSRTYTVSGFTSVDGIHFEGSVPTSVVSGITLSVKSLYTLMSWI